MKGKRERRLMKKMKHWQETVSRLLTEYKRLLEKLEKQKSTETTGDSDHSVKTPLTSDATKQLKGTDLTLESVQKQLKGALRKYLSTQPDLPTSAHRSTIQSEPNQGEVVQVTSHQQDKLSDDKGHNEAKLHPTALEPQAPFTGTLPDDVYTHLMSAMGIQECLLSNRLVCSFWKDLVLKRCHNQKSLKLFETFKTLMKYGELLLEYGKTDDTSLILKSIGDDLIVDRFEIDDPGIASNLLTTFFPSVEELVLCASEVDTLEIEHLLPSYAEQLTSLTMIYFSPWNVTLSRKLRAFTFPKLKTLNIVHFSLEDEQLLTLLPQLESLTLKSTKMSLETLLRTGTQLRELSIAEIKFNSVYTEPEEDFSKRPPISRHLRKFAFQSTKDELQTLEFISQNLTSLEYLMLHFGFSYPIYINHLQLLTPYLAPLHQLHSLTFNGLVCFFDLDDAQLAEIQPLPAVRHLKLILSDFPSISMHPFSRALFAAFPKVEQVFIAFAVNESAATFAAFEDFASQHPTVVKLFRSKNMSRFSAFPNAVAPLLGHHRQVYEEYIAGKELFGVSIGELAEYLVKQEGEDGPNLKIILRPVDRLAAMSALYQLLENDGFDFPFETADAMIKRMVKCTLKYDSSQGALFAITCQCVLSLLSCSAVKAQRAAYFIERMLAMVEHYHEQQFKEEDLLLQLHTSLDRLIEKMFDSRDCTLMIYVVDQFKGEYRPHRVEIARALLRVLSSRTKNCFPSN